MAKAKKKTVRISAKLQGLIGGAASIGYQTQGAFTAGVELAKAIGGKNRVALADAGRQYVAGYVVRYLEDHPAYMRRVGNMNQTQRFADAIEMQDKPEAGSTKPNRRTELEQRAVRAGQTSWSTCKRRAGLVAERKGGRKPRPGANKKPVKALPIDLTIAAPKLASKKAANDFFANSCAALLTTWDKNAGLKLDPRISTALTDLRAALVTVGIMAPATK
jgi:hypothetical protein